MNASLICHMNGFLLESWRTEEHKGTETLFVLLFTEIEGHSYVEPSISELEYLCYNLCKILNVSVTVEI